MLQHQTIAKQILFAIVVNIAILVFSALKIVLLTRSLELEEYGIVSLVMITVTLLTYLCTMGLDQYLMRTLPGKSDLEQINITKTCILFTLAVSCLILPFAYWGMSWIHRFHEYISQLYLIFPITFISVYFTLLAQYYYARQKLYFYNMMLFCKNVLWIFILLGCYYLFKITLEQIFLFWLVGLLATVVAPTIKTPFRGIFTSKGYNKKILINGLKFGLPLMPYFFGMWLMILLPRYMLVFYKDLKVTAIFSLGYALCDILYLIVVNVPDMFFSHILKYTEADSLESLPENKESYNELLKKCSSRYSIYLLLIGMVLTFFFRHPLIVLLCGNKYELSSKIIPLLMFLPLIRICIRILEQKLLVGHKTITIGIAYLLGSLCSLALGQIFISKIGLFGAVWTLLLSFLVVYISMWTSADFKWLNRLQAKINKPYLIGQN